MAKRKVVLFIVEGPSEELALGLILSRLFEASNEVRFEVMHGDPLTKWRFSKVPQGAAPAEKIDERIRNSVLDYLAASSPKLGWSNLDRVIQLTDTDGSYVDDSMVEAPDAETLQRKLDTFHMKQASTQRLLRRSMLTYKRKSVPYSLYYFSSNLEHALHGIENELSDEDKTRLAREFQLKYRNDIAGFLDLMQEICPSEDYRESWDFIQTDVNSRNRWSNLGLALPRGLACALSSRA